MTDYCRGEKAEDSHSREYRKYTQSRGYFPVTVAEYEKVISQKKKIFFFNLTDFFANRCFEKLDSQK